MMKRMGKFGVNIEECVEKRERREWKIEEEEKYR